MNIAQKITKNWKTKAVRNETGLPKVIQSEPAAWSLKTTLTRSAITSVFKTTQKGCCVQILEEDFKYRRPKMKSSITFRKNSIWTKLSVFIVSNNMKQNWRHSFYNAWETVAIKDYQKIVLKHDNSRWKTQPNRTKFNFLETNQTAWSNSSKMSKIWLNGIMKPLTIYIFTFLFILLYK